MERRCAKVAPGVDGFVPIRIYYGWALYVLVEGDAASFSTDASARIFDVDAKVKAQASRWGATTRIALRGLTSKVPAEVVVPRDVNDIVTKFEVDAADPQPILVDYAKLGAPVEETIAWRRFTEPGFEDFDGEFARYRLYRDPRVAPGTLRVRMSNQHPSDWAVWEIWQRGSGGHDKRWEQGGSSYLERDIPTPPWPIDLVWVGHRTRTPNAVPDAETGWSVDLVRIR